MGTDLYSVRVTRLAETSDVFPRCRDDISGRVLQAKKVRGRSKLRGEEAFARAMACVREEGAEAGVRLLFDLLCNNPKTPHTNVFHDWPTPVPCDSFDAWRAHFNPKKTSGNLKWRTKQAKIVARDLDEALKTEDPFALLAGRYEIAFHRCLWLAQNTARLAFADCFAPVSAAEVTLYIEDIYSQGREVGMPALGTVDARMDRFAAQLVRDRDYFASPIFKRYGDIMNAASVAGELVLGVEQREWKRRTGLLRVAMHSRWLGELKEGDEYRSRAS